VLLCAMDEEGLDRLAYCHGSRLAGVGHRQGSIRVIVSTDERENVLETVGEVK